MYGGKDQHHRRKNNNCGTPLLYCHLSIIHYNTAKGRESRDQGLSRGSRRC